MAEPETRNDRARGQPGGSKAGDRPAEARAFEAVRDVNRAAAEQGHRALDQSADMWRQAMHPMVTASAEMGRWFDEMWRQTWGGMAAPTFPGSLGAELTPSIMGVPRADMRESERAYTLSVELAGLKSCDVEVAVEGDQLVVHGTKTESGEEVDGARRISERRFGRFERRFSLPKDADPEGIKADCSHGVLKVTLPKYAEAGRTRRKIEVRGEDGPAQSRR